MKALLGKEKVLHGFILLFIATLFFPKISVLSISAVVLLVLYSISFNSWKGKWELLKKRSYLKVMILYFLMLILSVLLSKNFNKGLSHLDPRLPLLYLPLSIGTLYLKTETKNKILLHLSVLTTIVSFICLLYGIYRSQLFLQPEFLYNDALTQPLGQQSIYIALLVNIAIYVLAYNIFYKKGRFIILQIIAVVLLFITSFLLASRIMMSVLYLSSISFVIYYIIKQKKYKDGILILLVLIAGVLISYQLFPKTFNRFKELSYTNFEYESRGRESHFNMDVTEGQWNGANFRLAAWKCGWELFLQNPVKGVDLGDKKDELFKVYRQKNFQFAIETNKNVHNNYLDILYSLGIIGFSLFIIGWIILPLVTALKYTDGLTALIIFTFACAWITEVYFDRNLGGMLTGFFIPFLLTDKHKLTS